MTSQYLGNSEQSRRAFITGGAKVAGIAGLCSLSCSEDRQLEAEVSGEEAINAGLQNFGINVTGADSLRLIYSGPSAQENAGRTVYIHVNGKLRHFLYSAEWDSLIEGRYDVLANGKTMAFEKYKNGIITVNSREVEQNELDEARKQVDSGKRLYQITLDLIKKENSWLDWIIDSLESI